MKRKSFLFVPVVCLALSGVFLSGCAVNFYKQSPRGKKQIQELKTKVVELEDLRQQEQQRFEQMRKKLENKLRSQINNAQVSVRVGENGLVIVLSDEILFDPGKAEVRKSAYPVLDKVSEIIVDEVPGKDIGISGHTDNVPIKYSGWKSNWELSTARATNVLYYLEGQGVMPQRLSATGYGEYRPVATNATSEGRAQNRRVEILVLPEFSRSKIDDVKLGSLK